MVDDIKIEKANMMKYTKLFAALLVLIILTWRCTSEQQALPDDCISNGVTLTLDGTTGANCGQADGSIMVTATGAGGDFTFTVNGQPAAASGNFQNLAAGSYIIVATEAGGCTAELRVDIQNADGVNATINTSSSDCENPTGRIVVNATGGVTPYEYRIDGNAFGSVETFSALSPGDYVVDVRDASGCELTFQVRVDSDVLFADINTLIQTNCALPACHGGSQAPDFRNAANITGSANRIGIRTGNRSMPPRSSGITLTDSQIAEIACWVADGAQDN